MAERATRRNFAAISEAVTGDAPDCCPMKFIVWVVVLTLVVIIHVVLEHRGVVDSIGWWYTLYSAGISTAILAGLAFLVRRLVRQIRKSRGDE